MKDKKQTIYWCNSLRFLAITGVIIIHVSGDLVIQTYFASNWNIANLYNSFSRFAVPLFAMLSGCFLFSKEKDIEIIPFLKRRGTRVVLPFIFWSIAYILFNLYQSYQQGLLSGIQSIFILVRNNILEGAAFHLWYVYLIIGLYLFAPILNHWIRKASEKSILYFLSIWVLSLFCNTFDLGNIRAITEPFAGFMGYFVLGYYLLHKDLHKHRKLISLSSISIFIISSLGVMIGTMALNKDEHQFVSILYDYSTPLVFLMSASIFLFVKYSSTFNTKNTIIEGVAKYSYGIYLIHILVLKVLQKLDITYNFIHPSIGIPITTISCLTLSFTILYALNKLPFLKRFIGV